MLFSVMPSSALELETSGKCGENVTWSYIEANQSLYISGTGDMESYEFSSDVPWYYYRSDIVSVVIQKGVTSVGKYAFSYCRSLTAVDASASSVTKIESNAFSECESLITVKLPETVCEIGLWAFSGCSDLKNINFPSSLKTVGRAAFSSCTSLSSAELPSGTETIEGYAFSGCKGLTKFTLPRGVKSFGDSVFSGCTYLSTLNVENGNEYYSSDGDDNLYNADKTAFILRLPTKIDSVFTLPDTVETIAGSAFYGCTNLTSVEYSPENVKEIKQDAFSGSGITSATLYAGVQYDGGVFSDCTQLQSVTVEDGTRSLSGSIFSGCTALESIIIPDSVTYISFLAFKGCTSLSSVTLSRNTEEIFDWVFWNCTSLKRIDIPDSVKSIGKEAFKNCTSLETVNIGSGTGYIASDAFSGCTAIKNFIVSADNGAFCSDNDKAVYTKDKTLLIIYPCGSEDESYTLLPETKVINYKAFSGCAALTDVLLNDGLETIRSEAFLNCTSLGRVIIPDTVTYISASSFRNTAFYNDTSSWTDNCLYNGAWLLEVKADAVKNLSVQPGTKYLSDDCLYKPSYFGSITIETVHLPESFVGMNDGTFKDCRKLTAFTVDADNAYYSADGETGVLYNKDKTKLLIYPQNNAAAEFAVPDTASEIAPYAFYYCRNLTKVTLPDSLKSIGKYSFYYCSKLRELNLPTNLESVGERAFYNCSNFNPSVLPSSVRYVGSNAFLFSGVYNDETKWDGNLLYMGDYLIDSRRDDTSAEITVKDGTRAMATDAIGYNFSAAEIIVLPAELEAVESGFLSNCESLKSIQVSEDNQNLMSRDGVLYNKDMTSLLSYPRARQASSFDIPETVTTLAPNAFTYCREFEHITIPRSVRMISEYAFGYCYSLKSISYSGTPSEWKSIAVLDGNELLESAEITFGAPYTETEVTRTSGGVTVMTAAHNIEDGNTLFIAGYCGGKVLDVEIIPLTVKDGSFTRELSGDIDTVVVYVWDGRLSPYINAPETITKNNFL